MTPLARSICGAAVDAALREFGHRCPMTTDAVRHSGAREIAEKWAARGGKAPTNKENDMCNFPKITDANVNYLAVRLYAAHERLPIREAIEQLDAYPERKSGWGTIAALAIGFMRELPDVARPMAAADVIPDDGRADR